ncbi:uncharacterized protein L969DRAFT_49061 [Mixia osmundae IAM 14324]|uniref:Rpr2-domain-containing protein n=1 Tax=Mixia osmundae (strain CBS 9802 / IAM 14324 / JCM 22182 / KY 12970) TaxID=764103 RepID=G7E445_MIXOS|nr:uncharacterized protein L969DRAFT_49061 [Mixia osmundae IAM 14324]KEI39700.1 hypothetical protein L969DRAFT_49061 [Mixia osmundae IAM 14324]GAA97605.1 hypothetical protein E5Q_04283 [Mixia osmundae IAM 14324]
MPAKANRKEPQVQNKELLLRISFLKQAGNFLAGLSATQPGPPTVSCNASGARSDAKIAKRSKNHATAERMNATTGSMMASIAQKATLRTSPALKRTICPSCRAVLVPGLTCSVRNRPSGVHGHLLKTTCWPCRAVRSLPQPPLLSSASENPAQQADGSSVPPEEIVSGARRSSARAVRNKKRARKPIFFERNPSYVTI